MATTEIVGVVIPAAGRGLRFGSQQNKIWTKVAGKTILDHTLAAFEMHDRIYSVVVSCSEFEIDRIRAACMPFDKVLDVVVGGASRAESVLNGLKALPINCDVALVHDAARPAVSQALITRVIDGISEAGAAIPGLQVTDSIRRLDENGIVAETLDRSELSAVQTPQGARLELLLDAYKVLGDAAFAQTDEAGILQVGGHKVKVVEGDPHNIKVTNTEDLERLKSILGENSGPDIRTGVGYDVHRFEVGRELWLGGVQFEHSAGLKGHSDADVVLHAVCDALLGAAGMGDIGVLFPDTDAKHKDRRSIEFVEEVHRKLLEAGWTVGNVDIALLLEAPKIMGRRQQIIAAIAGALQIETDRVNIKATTAEGLGFAGNREGAACWATATLIR